MIDMVVDVINAPLSLLDVTDIVVTIRRPDESVIERPAFAISDDVLDLDLHPADLTLSGTYVGQVSYQVDGATSIFGPAFQLLRGPEGAT